MVNQAGLGAGCALSFAYFETKTLGNCFGIPFKSLYYWINTFSFEKCFLKRCQDPRYSQLYLAVKQQALDLVRPPLIDPSSCPSGLHFLFK